MNSDSAYYPEWLGPRLIDDAFPWDSSLTTSLDAFFEQYTLHDSVWIGLHFQLDQSGAAVAIIRFDAFWTDGRIPHPGTLVAEWPILLIRLTRVTSVQLSGFANADWPSRTIGAANSVVLSPDQQQTRFEDIFNGVVEIVHRPEVTILCFDRSGIVVPLPFSMPYNER